LDTVDETALNDYLRRDSAVSQRYRELDADAVPASLDHAVLAQARAAIAEKKPSRWRGVTRWSAPLALAASVVVVVSIVREPAMRKVQTVPVAAPAPMANESAPLRYEMPEEEAPVRAIPQSTAAAVTQEQEARKRMQVSPEAKQARPAESMRAKKFELDRNVRDEAVSNAQQLAAQSVATPPPPPVEFAPPPNTNIAHPIAMSRDDVAAAAQRRALPPPSDSDLSEVIVTGQVRRPAPSSGAGPRGTVPALPKPDGAVDEAFSEDEPEAWLRRIREWRNEGLSRRADDEWLRFRQKYPDFVVEDADIARPPR